MFFFYADIAQLVRALACHAKGREFKSRYPRHFWLHRLSVRSSPFQGGEPGSTPGAATNMPVSSNG